ncbi:MAG: helix-turn-helix domain-containing protein [Myxococcales bacterium]|nr:helix-turn-helix domain-containing protein [Myxococcales bacterium]
MSEVDDDDLLAQVGRRLRERRRALDLTVRSLAETSGLSPRYVISAEHGEANLSLQKLRALCDALDMAVAWAVSADEPRGAIDALLAGRTPAELAEVEAWLRARFAPGSRALVALLGVRGAGKSSVGRRVAERLGVAFVELDERVEQLADLSLAEIFAVHGEDYYRRLELDALQRLIRAGRPAVVATGGGIVTHPENFARLRAAATTVWLRARPEDHWDRVILQGDRRPMRDHPHAMAELRALLAERAPLYSQADAVVETSGRALDAVVDEVMLIAREAGGVEVARAVRR